MEPTEFYSQAPATLRPSACAEASRGEQVRRLSLLTVEQRIHAALARKNRFAWLNPAPRSRQP